MGHTEQKEYAIDSVSFLSLIVLERGGFELSPFLKMMKEVYEKYPVITSRGSINEKYDIHVVNFLR